MSDKLLKRLSTQKRCNKAFKLNKTIFKDIPNRFKHPKMCKEAFKYDKQNLEYIPDNLITPKMYKRAFKPQILEENLCKICYQRKVKIKNLPCEHLYCLKCYNNIELCAFCRGETCSYSII
jgi:Zinc finger, C3HC4 type (RING finger)